MKSSKLSPRIFASVLSTLILGISVSACSMDNKTSWKEEVLLHDGKKVIVKRALERGGRHEIGQRGGAINETLTFHLPGTQQEIMWEDKLSEDIGNSSFSPIVLDVVDGIAYVVAMPAGCLSYNKWGRPNPPYVVFKFHGKDWSRIPLEQLPAQIKTPNLIVSSPDDEAKKSGQAVVSAETIKELNALFQRLEYKTVLREPVRDAESSCPVMVSYGRTGGWIGLDWFTGQPSLQACLDFCDTKKVSAETCPCNSIFGSKK